MNGTPLDCSRSLCGGYSRSDGQTSNDSCRARPYLSDRQAKQGGLFTTVVQGEQDEAAARIVRVR
jgi:hypothetical protein